MRRSQSLLTRWLGVGLSSCLAVVTVALALTERLSLYINPSSAWFAVGMSVLLLIGAIASFALPLGDEADHGHDHGEAEHAHAAGEHADDATERGRLSLGRPGVGALATATGGILASGVVVTMLVTPPTVLSAELAMSRDVGAPPLFAGSDVITLATSGDTSQFGVGEWASVFATATNPGSFDGDPVTLTGFVTPGDDGAFDLTRLVITHCVIDAQPASIPVTTPIDAPDTGQWVTISGTIRATGAGGLELRADEVAAIDVPQDPYEY